MYLVQLHLNRSLIFWNNSCKSLVPGICGIAFSYLPRFHWSCAAFTFQISFNYLIMNIMDLEHNVPTLILFTWETYILKRPQTYVDAIQPCLSFPDQSVLPFLFFTRLQSVIKISTGSYNWEKRKRLTKMQLSVFNQRYVSQVQLETVLYYCELLSRSGIPEWAHLISRSRASKQIDMEQSWICHSFLKGPFAVIILHLFLWIYDSLLIEIVFAIQFNLFRLIVTWIIHTSFIPIRLDEWIRDEKE